MNPTAHPTHRFPARRSQAGYVMAEVILAFAILGIALAGLFPLVVGQIRLTTKLETRFQGDVYYYKDVDSRIREDLDSRIRVYPTTTDNNNSNRYPEVIHHAVPWNNPRMQSLLGGAVITTDTHDGDFTSYQCTSALIMITHMVDHTGHSHPPILYLTTTDDYQKPKPDPELTKPLKYATIYNFQTTYPDYPDISSAPTITVLLNVEVQ